MKETIKKNILKYYNIGKTLLLKYKHLVKSIVFWQLFLTIINFTKLNLFLLIVLGIITILIND